MRLNPDCIRSVLLYIEDNQTTTSHYVNDIRSSTIIVGLKDKYSDEDIFYSIKQLCDSYYLDYAPIKTTNSLSFIIKDITPLGHKFLQDIHNDTIWSKTKDIATKVGSFSLDSLQKIATEVITSMITSSLK